MPRILEMLVKDEGGTAVEYGLMAALIAAAIVLSVTTLGLSTRGLFERVSLSIFG